MGGERFEQFATGDSIEAAFVSARDSAAWEHGHGGYTGTIAEKPGYELRKQEPMTMEEARLFAEEDGSENDKWGEAFAVRVKDATHDGWLFYGWASC